jgi:hypothetical protein
MAIYLRLVVFCAQQAVLLYFILKKSKKFDANQNPYEKNKFYKFFRIFTLNKLNSWIISC